MDSAEVIVFIIVFAIFILRVLVASLKSSAKKKSSTARPNQPVRGTKTARPNQPVRGTKTARPNRPVKDTKRNKPAEPVRLETASKPDSLKRSAKRSKTEANAILDAARENTIEVECENDRDAIETENLMGRVYDVMVKGPDDSLVFQRDFVAEAMETLNRITLPDEYHY